MNVRHWFNDKYTVERMEERKNLSPDGFSLADQLSHANCSVCNGNLECPECDGRGQYKETCPECDGLGHCVHCQNWCELCAGRGILNYECDRCKRSGLCPEFEKPWRRP